MHIQKNIYKPTISIRKIFCLEALTCLDTRYILNKIKLILGKYMRNSYDISSLSYFFFWYLVFASMAMCHRMHRKLAAYHGIHRLKCWFSRLLSTRVVFVIPFPFRCKRSIYIYNFVYILWIFIYYFISVRKIEVE